MNDKQIECFLRVADLLSFTRAANELFITQPAVTHQIITLESEIGFPLFVRNNKSVTLTAAGQHFYECMQDLTAQMRQAMHESGKLARQEGLYLSVGHFSPEGDSLFSPALSSFSRLHPEYVIDIRLPYGRELVGALRLRRLDAIIAPEQAVYQNGEFDLCPMYENPEYCVVARTHPFALKESLTLADLKDTLCLIGENEYGRPFAWHERQLLGKKAQYRTRNGHTIREMVASLTAFPCAMIAVSPISFISNDVVRIPFSDGPMVKTVMAWRRDNLKTSLAPFVDFLSGYYKRNTQPACT